MGVVKFIFIRQRESPIDRFEFCNGCRRLLKIRALTFKLPNFLVTFRAIKALNHRLTKTGSQVFAVFCPRSFLGCVVIHSSTLLLQTTTCLACLEVPSGFLSPSVPPAFKLHIYPILRPSSCFSSALAHIFFIVRTKTSSQLFLLFFGATFPSATAPFHFANHYVRVRTLELANKSIDILLCPTSTRKPNSPPLRSSSSASIL